MLCYKLEAFFDVHAVFEKAEFLVNLKLKFPKCLIIPFGGGGFILEMARVIAWLHAYLSS